MDNHQHRSKKLRAINGGPKSSVAQKRRVLYQRTLVRVREAMDGGFYLEAITLLESLITDRLEARSARIHNESDDKRVFTTLGRLVQPLVSESSAEPHEAQELYREVRAWSAQRNEALHEFAKLAENHELTWEQKYEAATLAAHDGLQLSRRPDSMVRKLNRNVKGD